MRIISIVEKAFGTLTVGKAALYTGTGSALATKFFEAGHNKLGLITVGLTVGADAVNYGLAHKRNELGGVKYRPQLPVRREGWKFRSQAPLKRIA